MPKSPKGVKKRRNAYYWRYRIRGKEVWVPLGSDLETARRRLRELKREGKVHRSELTVYEVAKRWLERCVPTGRNEKNQRLAAVRVERYLLQHFHGVRVSDLKPDDLRGYRLWLETRGISPATVKHILGDLRTMLRWSEDEGYLERSPFPRRLLPRLQEQPPDRLTDEEVERLLAMPEPYRYVIRLGLATGLRWGELTRARADDVQNGMLTVYRTKSGKLRRVPISEELYRGRVGLLCPFRSGGSFQRTVRRKSGVTKFHAHQLRHTMACRWLEAGGSLAALQELLGHSSVVVTQRYARLAETHVRAEAERLRVGERSGERDSASMLQVVEKPGVPA